MRMERELGNIKNLKSILNKPLIYTFHGIHLNAMFGMKGFFILSMNT